MEKLEVRPITKRIKPLKLAGNKTEYVCTICEEGPYLFSREEVEQHAEQFHGGSRMVCEICDYHVSVKNGLKNLVKHRLSSHRVATEGFEHQTFPCLETKDDCKFIAQSVRELVDHMLSERHLSANSSGVPMSGGLVKTVDTISVNKDVTADANSPSKQPSILYQIPRVEVVMSADYVKCRKCNICGELIPVVNNRRKDKDGRKAPSLTDHAREMHGGKMYKCGFCDQAYEHRLNLARHVKMVHGLDCEGFTLIECHHEGCDKVFKTKSDFARHLISHKRDTLAYQLDSLTSVAFQRAPTTGTRFGNYRNVKADFEAMEADSTLVGVDTSLKPTSTSGGALQCDICGMTCTNKDPQMELELHMKMEHSTQTLLCTLCGESFGDEYTLAHHTINKHQVQIYGDTDADGNKKWKKYQTKRQKVDREKSQCPSCKLTATSEKLTYHYRIVHMAYKRFGCNICYKQFSDISKAKYHILKVHDGKGNMEGKMIKAGFNSDYFEDREVIEDFKVTEPDNYPDRRQVLLAMAKARQQNAATAVT